MGLTDDHQHDAYANGVDGGHAGQRTSQTARVGADGLRRVEVITGQERRRRWSREEKTRITAASFAPDTNVAAVARQHGVSVGLLHYWRRCARESVSHEALRLVPVVSADASPQSPVRDSAGPSIEIEFDGVCIRVNGAVDAATLRAVVAAVRARA